MLATAGNAWFHRRREGMQKTWPVPINPFVSIQPYLFTLT